MIDNYVLALVLLSLPVKFESSVAVDRQRVVALIGWMGADDFHRRERAMRELRKMGWGAKRLLESAQDDADPEVRRRVRWLLAELNNVPTCIVESLPLVCCLTGPPTTIPTASVWRQPLLWLAQRRNAQASTWDAQRDVLKAACPFPRRIRGVIVWWYMARALHECGYEGWLCWPPEIERYATYLLLRDLRQRGVTKASLQALVEDMRCRQSPVPLAVPECPQWIKTRWGFVVP